MTAGVLRFVLVPDASASRRLRRTLAGQSGCDGVVVGTWRELLELALQVYLPSRPATDWSARFSGALTDIDDAFWSRSHGVAPDETAAAVETAYLDLLRVTGLDGLPAVPTLPGRAGTRYADLRRLFAGLGGTLPEPLLVSREVLRKAPTECIRRVAVVHVPGFPPLTPNEQALVDHLNTGLAADDIFREAEKLRGLAEANERATTECALGCIQRELFTPGVTRGTPDASVQWVGCRDALEEAELAAGIVQRLLATRDGLLPSDVALLLPDDYVYSLAVEDTFNRAGLVLSGLPVERWRRDLGRDVVLQFLHCRQRPAPAMAMAACLTSPLMPWAADEGAELAKRLMDGNYELAAPRGFGASSDSVLALLREGDEGPATLRKALQRFGQSLVAPAGLEIHLERARQAIATLLEALEGAPSLDWRGLRRLAAPRYLAAEDVTEFNQEGITVWREGQEPWRPVRHLVVLGYTAGHYPVPAPASPVFTDEELVALGHALGLPLVTNESRIDERRRRLCRQLSAVSVSATFMVPRRGLGGELLNLPDCHVFMADVLGCQDDAEALVMDVDDAAQRACLHDIPEAAISVSRAPRAPMLDDLDFGRDLLGLRVTADGTPKPESPSGLETLMVSPLGWLLRRLGVEPTIWQPERANRQLLGQLAHAVFEDLFQPGAGLPQNAGLVRRVQRALDARIAELAPFMRAAQWQVERRNLAGALSRAAVAWRDILEKLGAEILGGELGLAGRFHGIDIHGQADLVLGLPDGRLVVVDYKLASSRGRRQRMALGFDSQVRLYREMLESGGPKTGNAALMSCLEGASAIGTVYYLLNDQTALTDMLLEGTAAIPHWQVVDADVSVNAIRLIERRLDDVRTGRVALNGIDDEVWFETTAGFTPYALDVSPLVRLHLRMGLAGELG